MEEKELVRWITQLTQTGYPPRHQIVREMAEEIRRQHVCQINEDGIEYVSYPPLSQQWAWQFIHRYTELETAILHTIEAARIKDTNYDVFAHWFDSVECVINEENIIPQNIYNMDKSGFSIGAIQAACAIINAQIRSRLQAHPGRQEWVSVVECICVDGSTIPPLIIFKGLSVSRSWIPDNVHDTWRFAHNTNG